MSSPDRFLKAADEIGNRLCREAIWDGQRCNWLGMWVDETSAMGDYQPPAYRACGPELYGGTSGIAFFLAQLYLCNPEKAYRSTAMAAIRQALSRLEEVIQRPLGFFSGGVGIAWTASLLGAAFDDGGLWQRGVEVVRELLGREDHRRALDLIDGSAGAIPALMSLYSAYRQQWLIERAVELGEQLVSSAKREECGWSWAPSLSSGDNAETPNLTGLAHGVSGFAWSLLELHRATGDAKFREAAEEGFRYERRWFSPREDNWADLRDFSGAAGAEDDQLHYLWQWCHGAPGIGLSRLRAYEILGCGTCRSEAETALQSTGRWMERTSCYDEWNYSLCHGLCGNAELFIRASTVFADATWLKVPEFIGDSGIRHYVETGAAWPCGLPEGESPSLMLGLAGVGHFYLRLYDPAGTMSILLIPVSAVSTLHQSRSDSPGLTIRR